MPRPIATRTPAPVTDRPDPPRPKRTRVRRRTFADIETPDPETMPRPDGTPAELPEEVEAKDGDDAS